MTLEKCIEIGHDCGLTTVDECVDNILIHGVSLFANSKYDEELAELLREFKEYNAKNKVTIEELYNNLMSTPTSQWGGIKDIAIVPREIVELIIERCESIRMSYGTFSNEGAIAAQIRDFAEFLLKDFEEEIPCEDLDV